MSATAVFSQWHANSRLGLLTILLPCSFLHTSAAAVVLSAVTMHSLHLTAVEEAMWSDWPASAPSLGLQSRLHIGSKWSVHLNACFCSSSEVVVPGRNHCSAAVSSIAHLLPMRRHISTTHCPFIIYYHFTVCMHCHVRREKQSGRSWFDLKGPLSALWP